MISPIKSILLRIRLWLINSEIRHQKRVKADLEWLVDHWDRPER